MWVIQTNIPYEGMSESDDLTTEEVLKYLGSECAFDDTYIRPVTTVYDPWEFIKKFKETEK